MAGGRGQLTLDPEEEFEIHSSTGSCDWSWGRTHGQDSESSPDETCVFISTIMGIRSQPGQHHQAETTKYFLCNIIKPTSCSCEWASVSKESSG